MAIYRSVICSSAQLKIASRRAPNCRWFCCSFWIWISEAARLISPVFLFAVVGEERRRAKPIPYSHGHGNLNMAEKKGQFRYCALIAFEDHLQRKRRVDNGHAFVLLHVGGIMHVNSRSGRRWVQNTRLAAVGAGGLDHGPCVRASGTVTKTARKPKSGIKNSDNSPHITLDRRGLGVDLVGSNGWPLPRICCFTTPTSPTSAIASSVVVWPSKKYDFSQGYAVNQEVFLAEVTPK